MTIQEFKERTKKPVTDSDYKKIEFVYTYHPAISETEGKDQIGYLYNTFGMRIIEDMTDTAEKAEEMLYNIRTTESKLMQLKEEYQQLKTAK